MLLSQKEGACICTGIGPAGLALVPLGTAVLGVPTHAGHRALPAVLPQHWPAWRSTMTFSGTSSLEGVPMRSNCPMFPTPGDFKRYSKLLMIWRRAPGTESWGLSPLLTHHHGCRVGDCAAWPGYGLCSQGRGVGDFLGWTQAGLSRMSDLQRQDSSHYTLVTSNFNI